MWGSIYGLARKLKKYKAEKIRDRFFGGKVGSSTLSEEDVRRLLNMNLGFVGEANVNFILRNMGGEFVKNDVWIKTLNFL